MDFARTLRSVRSTIESRNAVALRKAFSYRIDAVGES